MANGQISKLNNPTMKYRRFGIKRSTFRCIPAPDDDPDTFAPVVKVADSRSDGIPDSVEFDTILQFLLLAHKYRLVDTTLTQFKIWIRHLKRSIPTSFNKQMMPWLWILWKLDIRTEFKALSATAQREARGRIFQDSIYQVPLPDFIPGMSQLWYKNIYS